MNGVRALLVDDNAAFARAARLFLETCDGIASVDVATSGADALERIAGRQHDLVVADLNMPGMNGLELTRRILELPMPPRVVMISADESVDARIEALRAGASDFISKKDLATTDTACWFSTPPKTDRPVAAGTSAPRPFNEAERLRALRRYRVLDGEGDSVMDGLTKLAAQVCDTPVALVSLVDDDRQWFMSSVGLPGVRETPRDIAFCAHAILNNDIMEVPDARIDDRFSSKFEFCSSYERPARLIVWLAPFYCSFPA